MDTVEDKLAAGDGDRRKRRGRGMLDGSGGNAGYRSTLMDRDARGCSGGSRGYRCMIDRFA